jgi:uncharacterized membrane protein
MKEGYFKEYWMTVLVTVFLLGVAIYTIEAIWFVAAAVFMLSMFMTYRSYDYAENQAEKWFAALLPSEKKRIYKEETEVKEE